MEDASRLHQALGSQPQPAAQATVHVWQGYRLPSPAFGTRKRPPITPAAKAVFQDIMKKTMHTAVQSNTPKSLVRLAVEDGELLYDEGTVKVYSIPNMPDYLVRWDTSLSASAKLGGIMSETYLLTQPGEGAAPDTDHLGAPALDIYPGVMILQVPEQDEE